MKSNLKSKIVILITLGIIFALVPKSTINPSLITGNSEVTNLDKENLKISAVSGKIHIINNSGWLDFRNAGNCTGSGTYSDPYVIEDLEIDGGGSGSCILIENSSVYFKIENCTVYNSSRDDAGIKLLGVSDGALISNNASRNDDGISLSSSNNNTISGNTANNNRYGIILNSSNNNTISGNTANNNDWIGISALDSDNNIVSGNTANSNCFYWDYGPSFGAGLRLIFSDNNNITENTANYNYFGISLEESNNNSVLGNTANSNFEDGIVLFSCNNITVSGNIMNGCGLCISGSFETPSSYNIDTSNLVNGKPLYYYINEVNLGPNNFTNAGQVILINCHDSLISNLNTSYIYVSNGISLYYCNNNTISGNTANYNDYGILLEYSTNTTVSGNTANYNNEGISLRSSDNNIISGNTANNNMNGIGLSSCKNTTVSGNNANNNGGGISLSSCKSITISGNSASNTFCGISLGSCKGITISGNTANNNWQGIFLYQSSNNMVSGNTANYNNDGIFLHSSHNNIISGNTANYNFYGINLWESNNNTISGNRLIGNQECIIEDPSCEGNVILDNYCSTSSLNYLPIILIISITIVGVSVFIIYQNRKRFRKPQQDVEFL